MVLIGRRMHAARQRRARVLRASFEMKRSSSTAAYFGREKVRRMFALAIVVLVGLAGYAGSPVWLVPLAAAAMTLEGWWDKLLALVRRPREPWSTKVTTYFATGILRDLLFAALAYALGTWVRVLSS
jgi:hypothetical protein